MVVVFVVAASAFDVVVRRVGINSSTRFKLSENGGSDQGMSSYLRDSDESPPTDLKRILPGDSGLTSRDTPSGS